MAVLKALIVNGSPEPSSPELVARLAEGYEFIIAVDRGAEVCRRAGVAPHLFCGDEDSIDAESSAWVHSGACREIALEVDKYATDLSVALHYARAEAIRRGAKLDPAITCATGGRPDHALAVIGLMLSFKDTGPVLIEDAFELVVLSPEGRDSWEFAESDQGKTFSAIALEPGTVVSEKGMRWELDGAELPLLGDTGVSNIIEAADAKVTCHEGALAAFLIKA